MFFMQQHSYHVPDYKKNQYKIKPYNEDKHMDHFYTDEYMTTFNLGTS